MTQRGAPRGGPKPVNPDRLERAAHHYIERYASSADQLRRVLMRRVRRSADVHGTDPADGTAWVDAIVTRLASAGLLDDHRFAENRARTLSERGYGRNRIALALRARGVADETITDTLDAAVEDAGGEFAAACRFARRRRLGPYREAERSERRNRDLAALARAGFPLDLARRVVDAESVEALDRMDE